MNPTDAHIVQALKGDLNRITGTSSQDSHILVVAYACSPGRGSEESVGWDTAEALCQQGHRVTVLTRTTERNACPTGTDSHPGLNIVCHDVPTHWQQRFDRMGKIGVEFGYLLWLQTARGTVRSLHEQMGFSSAQHVTYARYWMPSPLRVLDIPWILGPVGGGESIPAALRATLSRSGRIFETVRDLMRRVGERSPSVRHAARSAAVCLANTPETEARLRRMGAQRIEIINSAALADREFDRLFAASRSHTQAQDALSTSRSGFISVGRLLDWKGFHLGLAAFAQSAHASTETYTIVGTGPFENQLKSQATALGIVNRVHFTGALPRSEVFDRIASARALIHPSLHESGGFVCLEAMACGTPVICIDIGGPGLFVQPAWGYPVPPASESGTIEALRASIDSVVTDDADYLGRCANAIEHVRHHHTTSVKAAKLNDLHRLLAGEVLGCSVIEKTISNRGPKMSRAATTRLRVGTMPSLLPSTHQDGDGR